MIKIMTRKNSQKFLISLLIGASFLSFLFVNTQNSVYLNNKTVHRSEMLQTQVTKDEEKSKELTVPALSVIEKVLKIAQKLVPGN
jgi:virulence-associated protein VapD